jgi:hypothetical protein
MIDSLNRKKVKRLLKEVALGRITSYQWENEHIEILAQTTDPAVYAFYRTLRQLCGDREHSLKEVFEKGNDLRTRVCRWLFFLDSTYEYEWPRTRLAPGIRDYELHWLQRLFGFYFFEMPDDVFQKQGDYNVWPFFREGDFKAARLACAERRRITA